MAALKVLRLFAVTVVLSATLMTMSACNTTKGAGKDLSATGDKLQDAADSAK